MDRRLTSAALATLLGLGLALTGPQGAAARAPASRDPGTAVGSDGAAVGSDGERVAPSSPAKLGRAITILQIGDSHTAADFFSGQLRRLLQAEFGDGGAGYIAPGKPRAGVRSSAMKIEASSGWSYSWLQTPKNNPAQFSLSGYEAVASAEGETLTYSSEEPVAWDLIEVETTAMPGGGSFTVSLDGKVETEHKLDAPSTDRVVFQLTPEHALVDRLREIRITTTSAAPVKITGVNVRNRSSGVSLSAIGFPGATVDILNRFENWAFQAEMKRLSPDIVVLAFGTNEGFNDSLEGSAYLASYRKALKRIRRAAPAAKIVLVAPPNANRLPPGCKAHAAKAICLGPSRDGDPPVTGTISGSESERAKNCVWRAPPKLEEVRAIQRRLATEQKLTYWNWADLMSPDCGAHEWAKADPQLMADDHVHLTIAGYKHSAEQLLPVLRSVLGQIQERRDALPNH